MASRDYSFTSRKLSLIAVAVLGAASGAPTFAQEAPGWYIGGNVGRTRADFDNTNINNTLAGQGFVINSRAQDNHDTGYKLYGGYRINRNFAVEGGYFDLGRFTDTFNTTPAGSFRDDTRVNGLNLDLLGILPIGDRFSAFGRVGAAYSRARSSYTSTGFVPPNLSGTQRNHTDIKIGLGVQYAITQALSVRAEVERYRVSDPLRNRNHIDMASVGLVYYFGSKPAPAPVYVAPPPPPPPPPAPRVVPPPPPPAPVYVPPERPAKQGRN